MVSSKEAINLKNYEVILEILKEKYYLNKEIHNSLSKKYEAFNDKALKLIPILTFILGIYGYLIHDWLIVEYKATVNTYEYYKYTYIVIVMINLGLIIVDIFVVLILIYRIIKQRQLTIIKLEKAFIEVFEKSEVKSFFPCKNEKWLSCIFLRNKVFVIVIFPSEQASHVS